MVVAYLYGSHARGRAGPLSDVDAALLLDRDDEEQQLELTAAITHAVAPARADVVILNGAPPALSYRVLRDGKVLVSRDNQSASSTGSRRSTGIAIDIALHILADDADPAPEDSMGRRPRLCAR